MDKDLHVVFGAGQVGTPLAARLLEAGKRVRVVRRSSGTITPGAEILPGDAADSTFCLEAVRGAVAVYHCMNPPYIAMPGGRILSYNAIIGLLLLSGDVKVSVARSGATE